MSDRSRGLLGRPTKHGQNCFKFASRQLSKPQRDIQFIPEIRPDPGRSPFGELFDRPGAAKARANPSIHISKTDLGGDFQGVIDGS